MKKRGEQLCPKFQIAMEILSRPWSGLLIAVLNEGPHRFGALSERLTPIGDRILSQRLKELTERGLVERHVLPGPPVHVEYALTVQGRGFSAVEEAIRAWGETLAAVATKRKLKGASRAASR